MLEAVRTLCPPPSRPLCSPLGMARLLHGVKSQCQTYLDMWGGAEDIDDSLRHIFRFQTLSTRGKGR